MSINKKSSFGIIKSFCMVLTGLACVLSVSFAYAKHEGFAPIILEDTILVNGQDPETLCALPLSDSIVQLYFEGDGSAPPGRAEQYFVRVDWGDGEVQVLDRNTTPPEIVFTPAKGKHVDFHFIADVLHEYPDVEASYFVIMKLFHSEPGGQDSPADAEVGVEICIRAPLDPTVNADLTLVNGEAPVFSCPLNPISRPAVITVEGGGEFTPLAGNTAGWEVEIDWADGTVDTFSEFTTDDGIDFMFTFEKDHEYLVDLGNGPHQIRIALLENPLSVATALPIDICFFTPQTPTVLFDFVNGVAPIDLSCPDSPLSGPVTVIGKGVGSATPESVDNYMVEVNWGDGTPTQLATSIFDPLSGVNLHFNYDYETPGHFFIVDGPQTISISLTYFDPSLPGTQTVLTETIDICTFNGIPPALQVDTISGLAPESLSCPDNPIIGPVTILGSGEGSAPPENVEDWGVEINWDDGSPVEIVNSIFTPSSGTNVNYTFVFDSSEHIFTLEGTYIASISLFVTDPLGGGNQIVLTENVEICVFIPDEPALQIDSVNEQAPVSISCPGSPFSAGVTVVGSGEGAALVASVEDWEVTVDWDDGTPVETIAATFAPLTGIRLNYTYDFEGQHTYVVDGFYEIAVRLGYFDPEVQDNLIAATDTVEICVTVPKGTITGEVSDFTTGLPIFGASVEVIAVEDFITEEDFTVEPPIPGSFAGGSVYSLASPAGLATVRVSAPGWVDATGQVSVAVGEISEPLNFALLRVPTSLNVVQVTLPILGSPGGGNRAPFKMSLVPECVEALQDGLVVQRVCVHAGNIFFFIGLEDGQTEFRGINSFFDVGMKKIKLDNDARDPGDDAPNKNDDVNVKIPVNLPPARASFVTGDIIGVIDEGGSPIAASVFATFLFEDVPVTIFADTNVDTGIFVLGLLPPGPVDLVAHANGNTKRSLVVQSTVVGGEVTTENIPVSLFDPDRENFVPIVLDPTGIAIAENTSVVVMIDDFTVTDFDHAFSVDHTLQLYPGFNYTLSDIQDSSTLLTPDPGWHGPLGVSVTVSDLELDEMGDPVLDEMDNPVIVNTSTPFILTVNVASIDDPTVWVDFDTGLPASSGGTGTEAKPYLTADEALGALLPDGTVMIKGINTSAEAPLTINQPATLQNNNTMGEVIRIDPNFVPEEPAKSDSTAKTGFVSQSGRPRR